MASRSVRLSLSILMFAVLMGQGAAPTAAAISGAGWQVVLAAGDDAEPVFDNATRELGQRLAAAGVSASNIHRLSANAAELSPDVEPAQAKVLLRRIAELPARMGDRCLVFSDLARRARRRYMARPLEHRTQPGRACRVLSRGCAAVPTVVVVSACYSGGFVSGKMAKPNRIILTAARRDRPSFGCQVHRNLQFFSTSACSGYCQTRLLGGRHSTGPRAVCARWSTRSARGPPSLRPISARPWRI